jgi:TolB protein
MTLSREGDPEIYIMDLASRSLQRLTNDRGIDTEPAFSPDGRRIAFTSDRGGNPQIYEMNLNGGEIKRLTFVGEYNARPRYSPDGKSMSLLHAQGGAYRIGILDLESTDILLLTSASLDESPSFAPNGSMIIYATSGRRGSELAAVSSDGSVHQRLALQVGAVQEPAWGPFPPEKP